MEFVRSAGGVLVPKIRLKSGLLERMNFSVVRFSRDLFAASIYSNER